LCESDSQAAHPHKLGASELHVQSCQINSTRTSGSF
jgi:hypothetical protein